MNSIHLMRIFFIYGCTNIFTYSINQIYQLLHTLYNIKIEYTTKFDVLNKCNDLEPVCFENAKTYDMIRRAQVDGASSILIIYSEIFSIFRQIFSVFSVICLLLTMKSKIFLFALITPIISSFYNIFIGIKKYNLNKKRTSSNRMLFYINFLLTNDIAFKEIKVFNIGKYFINLSSKIFQINKKEDTKIIKKQLKFNTGINLIDECIGIYIIYRIILMAKDGNILIGDIITYINGISSLQSNIKNLLNGLSDINSDILYIEDYFEFLELSFEKDNKYDIVDNINKIEIKNLSFRYQPDKSYVLKDVNLTLEKGEKYVLIGENGSGKSTLIKLILGFYDDYEGSIYVNGTNLKDINKQCLREKIAVMFQDYNKYELSLRENMTFGSSKYQNDDEYLLSLLNDLNLDIIDLLPNGLDTQLGNWFNGVELSKGQWQKVALGRVLLKSADLYIWDEPTASIDNVSSAMILSKINTKFHDSIQLLITHQYNEKYMKDSNIIVLNKGGIECVGLHDDLIKRSTKYREFVLSE